MNWRCPTFVLSNESAELTDGVLIVRCKASIIRDNSGSVDFTLIGLIPNSKRRYVPIRINRDSKNKIGNMVFREILRKRLYGEILHGFQVLHDDNGPYPQVFCALANELKKLTRRRKELDVVTTVNFTKIIRLGKKCIKLTNNEGWVSVKERCSEIAT